MKFNILYGRFKFWKTYAYIRKDIWWISSILWIFCTKINQSPNNHFVAVVVHSPLDPPVSTISKSSSSSWSCLICFSQLWVLKNVPTEVKDGTLWLEVKEETWPDIMEETLLVVEHKELELLFPADWYSQSSFLLLSLGMVNLGFETDIIEMVEGLASQSSARGESFGILTSIWKQTTKWLNILIRVSSITNVVNNLLGLYQSHKLMVIATTN